MACKVVKTGTNSETKATKVNPVQIINMEVSGIHISKTKYLLVSPFQPTVRRGGMIRKGPLGNIATRDVR